MIGLEHAQFNPNEWTKEIIREVNETEEAFIFSAIAPFMNSITTIEISKEELVRAIHLVRLQKEAIEKYGVPISNNWDTAVQQFAALYNAYRAGFHDGIEQEKKRIKNILEE